MTIEHVAAILNYVLMIPLTWLLLRLDERRLAARGIPSAWVPSARNVYIYQFAPYCLLVHFARTRPWYSGWFLGIASTVLLLVIHGGVAYAIASAFNLPIPS